MTVALTIVAALVFAVGVWILVRRRDLVVMAAGTWALGAAAFLAYAAATGGAGDEDSIRSLALLAVVAGQPVLVLGAALAHHRVRRTVHCGGDADDATENG